MLAQQVALTVMAGRLIRGCLLPEKGFKEQQLVLYGFPPVVPVVGAGALDIGMGDIAVVHFLFQGTVDIEEKIILTAIEDEGKGVLFAEQVP